MNCLPALYQGAPPRLTQNGARLRWRPDPFMPAAREGGLVTGVTLLQGVREALAANGYNYPMSHLEIMVADSEWSRLEKIPRAEWATRLIRPGEFIQVGLRYLGGGGGGKNPMRTLLTVLVALTATAVAYWVPTLGPVAAMEWAGVFGAALGAVTAIGGMMLVNAIAPLSTPKLNDSSGGAEQVWSIDGIQNRADLYGMVPFILGRVRFAPRYGARPYTLLKGQDQYSRYLFVAAGRNRLSDLRIGDTSIDFFKGVEYVVHENWRGEAFKLFPAAVFEENVNITLTGDGGRYIQTTADGTVRVETEINFTQGLSGIDKKNRRYARTVEFEILWRPKGSEEWTSPFGEQRVNASSTVVRFSGLGNRTFNIYAAADGSITTTETANSDSSTGWSGVTLIASASFAGTFDGGVVTFNYAPGAKVQLESTVEVFKRVEEYPISSVIYVSYVITVSASAGTAERRTARISAATLTPFRHGFSWPAGGGQYEVAITRLTPNHDPNDTGTTILENSVWSVIRSVSDGKVINYDNAPLTVIELEIKASDQLNGHVQEFNALFESYCPVWNGSEWVEEPSNNAAAVAMLVCTTPHVRRVKVDDPYQQLNLDEWQGFYEWCADQGWTYNGVQTGQELVRQVLSNVLASARAAFTFPNGKLGVTWDGTDKPAVYVFDPRNSWGFKASKTFVLEQPHGLRVRFLNEEKDYQEDERIVYADDYDHTNATNIIEVEFDGVTNAGLIYKLARLRLADSMWRSETYEFSTDFAFLCVNKGDRIQMGHDVPMWGLRQARVLDVKYADYDMESMNRAALLQLATERQKELAPDRTLAEFVEWLKGLETARIRQMIQEAGVKDESRVTAIILDDLVSMETGKEYGLKCYETGRSANTYSIKAQNASTNELELYLPIPTHDAPQPGQLAHFGYSGRESHDLIVVGINTNDNLSATIYAQDYSAEEIHAAMTGPIPPWNSDISLPSRWQYSKPERPMITRVRTDEYVLQQLADGSLIPRIMVNYTQPEKQNVELQAVYLEYRELGEDNTWINAGYSSGSTGSVYASNVSEGVDYELRLYAVSTTGVSSEYSSVRTAKVIGRTTPPPAPIAVHIDGTRIWWEMPEDYPIDVRGWEVWIGYDAEDPFSYAKRVTTPSTTQMEFDAARYAGNARRVWIRTVDDIGLTSEPVSVGISLGDILLNNVIFEMLERADRNWPGIMQNGTLDNGRIVPEYANYLWNRPALWGVDHLWANEATYSVSYTSAFLLPTRLHNSWLSIHPELPDGGLASIEYCFGEGAPLWDRIRLWTGERLWAWNDKSAFQPMPDKVWIQEEEIIAVRVTTVPGSFGSIDEIRWVFDVEDEIDKADNLFVPVEGARVPFSKPFREITNIVFGVEYQQGDTVKTALWLDKGVIMDDRVVAGPLIQCVDLNNIPVAGIVDVTMQGVKGA